MVTEEVIIANSKELEEVKRKIVFDGTDKLHVLADFDLTLTKALVDGIKTQSLMQQLRNGKYLTSDYVKKSHELFDMYHPIEIDPNIPIEEKIKKMEEWWETHFKLLIDTGLDKKTLDKLVNETNLEFREGSLEFLDYLNENKIPLVIISSSGLGSVIPMYLEKKGRLYDNIHIVANLFEFNEEGKLINVNEPIIHVLNKSEVSLKQLPIYSKLEKRKNVILLGDSLGDLGMIEGFDYNNLIKIGFLNENIKSNLKYYKESFDVVITNDGSFDYVNQLMQGLVK